MSKSAVKELRGSTVLVTGASRGFGFETTVELARRGYRVFATMRNPDASSAALHEATRDLPGKLIIRQMDVTNEAEVIQVVDEAAEGGRLEAIVNNAGVGIGGLFQHTSDEQLRHTFDANLFGLCNVTRAAIPHFRARRSGTIVMLSSVGGRVAFPMVSAYAASKHAVEGVGESLRSELAPYGVSVVLVEPGAFNTSIHKTREICGADDPNDGEMTAKLISGAEKSAERFGGNPKRVAKLIAKVIETDRPRLRYLIGPDVPVVGIKRFLPHRPLEFAFSFTLKRAGYGKPVAAPVR
jgi:NAD(P)-dependent dehydrogenase (short-subunit alcohol dehydrogenase family)